MNSEKTWMSRFTFPTIGTKAGTASLAATAAFPSVIDENERNRKCGDTRKNLTDWEIITGNREVIPSRHRHGEKCRNHQEYATATPKEVLICSLVHKYR